MCVCVCVKSLFYGCVLGCMCLYCVSAWVGVNGCVHLKACVFRYLSASVLCGVYA